MLYSFQSGFLEWIASYSGEGQLALERRMQQYQSVFGAGYEDCYSENYYSDCTKWGLKHAGNAFVYLDNLIRLGIIETGQNRERIDFETKEVSLRLDFIRMTTFGYRLTDMCIHQAVVLKNG
jgi:hypothetical protein